MLEFQWNLNQASANLTYCTAGCTPHLTPWTHPMATTAHVALNTLCLSAAAALGSLPFFFLTSLTERAMAAGNALAGQFHFGSVC